MGDKGGLNLLSLIFNFFLHAQDLTRPRPQGPGEFKDLSVLTPSLSLSLSLVVVYVFSQLRASPGLPGLSGAEVRQT